MGAVAERPRGIIAPLTGTVAVPTRRDPADLPPSENKELFGRLVRELRYKKGLNQERMSERMDVEPRYVSLVETGRVVPTLDQLLKMARGLDMSLTDFIRATWGKIYDPPSH
jgi:ribosome-binding protein aMBF1 (putative translation factor)